MDNVPSSDGKLSLDNAPAGMAPMEAPASEEKMPDTSSGETPQNDAAGVEEAQAPQTEEAKPEEPKDEKILGKFNSQADLEKAYTELESHSKKTEMERAELEKLFTPQSEETDPAPADDVQTESTDSAKDLLSKLKPALRDEFTKLLSPTIAKLEVQDMVNKYSDFPTKAKEVAEKKKQNPSLSMEDAYKLIKFDDLKRTSYNQGVSETNATTEAKQKAQVESSQPSGMRPTTIEDAIKDPNTTVSEIADAMGPEWNRFKEISERKAQQLKGTK